MKKRLLDPFTWCGLILALAVLFLLTGCGKEPVFEKNSSVVKIKLLTGHGSGVILENGYILTAAHVVTDLKTVSVYFEDHSFTQADVLWTSKDADVALLKFKDTGRAEAAYLSCRVPAEGEAITAVGHPMAFENITTRGFITGAAFKADGHWKEVISADITILPGMSGGPVYDAAGNVVGLSVGTALWPIGMTPTWGRIGLVVSGRSICDLMGRVA